MSLDILFDQGRAYQTLTRLCNINPRVMAPRLRLMPHHSSKDGSRTPGSPIFNTMSTTANSMMQKRHESVYLMIAL